DLDLPGVSVMSLLSRDLVFLILQFLDEEKFKDFVHRTWPWLRHFFSTPFQPYVYKIMLKPQEKIIAHP
ncbi:hypothetical protein RYX36_022822, partial [Vicia faba]